MNIVLKPAGSVANPAMTTVPANVNFDAHRALAEWLYSFEPPAPLEVILADGTAAGIGTNQPLPTKPFRIQTVMLVGAAFEGKGDEFLAEFASRLKGVSLSWISIGTRSATSKGVNAVLKTPDLAQVKKVSIRADWVDDGVFNALAGLKELRSLELISPAIKGQGLHQLERLESLCLGVEDLSVERMRDIAELPRLQYFQDGPIPRTLEHCQAIARSRLKVVSAFHNDIDDNDLAILSNLPTLEVVALVDNPITDAGLAHLKRLKRLNSLNLNGTKVTAAGVADLQQALPNCKIAWTAPMLIPKTCGLPPAGPAPSVGTARAA